MVQPGLVRNMEGLHYFARNVFDDIPVSAVRSGSVDVYMVSDRPGNVRGRVSAETMLLSGGTVSVFEDMTATANASTKATSVPVGEMPGNCQEGNVSDT